MAETKLDLHELDEILQRNTSELPNHLQGASFSVFNNNGGYCCTLLSFKSFYNLHVVSTKLEIQNDTDFQLFY